MNPPPLNRVTDGCGQGILRGMGVTLKNFFGSFVSKERFPLVAYPEKGNTLKPGSRNFPFLVYDGANPIEGMRCTACLMCEKHCPPQCIHIEKDMDEHGKPMKRPKVFDIDLSICMSCGICSEVCPFESIWMDSAFEMATSDRFGGLLARRNQLLKSNAHFHRTDPRRATASDERIAEKKAKEEERERANQEREAAKAAKEKQKKEEDPS